MKSFNRFLTFVFACSSFALAQEIVVSPADGGAVKLTGGAKLLSGKGKEEASHLGMGAYGKKGNDGDGTIMITPNIPQAGDYAVYLRWYSAPKVYHGQSVRVPVTVRFDGGSRTLFTSQQAGNEWIFFGVYPFAAGRGGSVMLSEKGTVGSINVEGVKFVPEKLNRQPVPKHLPVAQGAADEFDKLRVKFADRITTPADANLADPDVDGKLMAEDFLAHLAWQTMSHDPAAEQLFPDIRAIKDLESNNDSWQNLKRLQAMAKAYVCSSPQYGFGQRMQGNPKLLADILAGLEWVNQHAFNDKCVNKAGGVWYANEIGSPTSLAEAMLCVFPALSADQKARYLSAMNHMNVTPYKNYINAAHSTGMNRVNLANVHVLRAIIEKDEARMKLAVESLDEPLTIRARARAAVEAGADGKNKPAGKKAKGKGGAQGGEGGEGGDGGEGDGGGGGKGDKKQFDGFYADGTFIQHGYILYNGGYGINLLRSFSNLLGLLLGSPYEIKNPKVANIPRWVYDGLEPLMAFGDEFPRTIGRAWGMKRAQNYVPGYGILETVTSLIPAVPPADAANFKAMVKGWMLEDHYKNLFAFDNYRLSLQNVATLKAIAADPSIPPRPRPVQSHVYHAGDFLAHHRPAFAAGLAMSSTRIATHECIFATNKRGWYQGDGMLMVYPGDPTRYNEDYRAVANPYRVPGTTVDTQSRQDGADGGSNSGAPSRSSWAGGVELGRKYSVGSMELQAQESTLVARKSWFFLDDEIVCLGAGITSTDSRTIETVVENAKLNAAGDNAFTINGSPAPAKPGWSGALADTRWVHLDGNTPQSGIGWYFPKATNLQGLREARTGTWNDVCKKEDPVPITRNFLTLWFDHGKNPKDAGYEYVILPGKNAEQTRAYAEKPAVEIVANTAQVQAVRQPALNLTMATFWEDKPATTAGISCDRKANVAVWETDKEVRVAVADPTQLNAGTINVRIERAGRPEIKASVPMKGTEGRTIEQAFPK